MNLVTRITTVAAFAVAGNALAEDAVSNGDARTSLALADLRGAHGPSQVDPATLRDYVGRYKADGGIEFVVFVENDALVIELPEKWGVAESRLRAEGMGALFVADVSVIVSFDIDAYGRVTALTAYPPQGESITAAKSALRRGIVTIEDVDAPRVQVAAATE